MADLKTSISVCVRICISEKAAFCQACLNKCLQPVYTPKNLTVKCETA